ncbi:hypothetical protein IEQ34_001277 [Dendrobium chrysotoxum]|uniref:Uncharacterized protein n=1 Tax=Dendrobium chrysotoxum TaxID=161865 RepID=A0AAV7HN92_DENCH|nr:hypothetical protein IEQ34_001277 [Dendrobium chrysotoxum]
MQGLSLSQNKNGRYCWLPGSPLCALKEHEIEPKNPEAHFSQTRDFLENKVQYDFVKERRRVKREYDEFKVRINSLPDSMRRRSDAYNAHEELWPKKQE